MVTWQWTNYDDDDDDDDDGDHDSYDDKTFVRQSKSAITTESVAVARWQHR